VQFPISIGLRRSRLLILLLSVFHGIAVACLIALPWPMALRLLLSALVGLSLVYALRPPRVTGLRLTGRDRLDCLLADGNYIAARALPDSTVYARLIVLRLRIGEEKRVSSLTLLQDQLSAEQFRQLRLWLRWQAAPKDGAGTVA
jgi:toxin CptA